MKFDTEANAILESELAYKKILEGAEFRSNESFLKDTPEEHLPSAWFGRQQTAEAPLTPLNK
jgi:hypothetical protein